MPGFDQTFPPLLSQLHAVDLDWDEAGMDFEPYEEFFPAEENRDWVRAWTGNQELDAAEYRIFGQDGTGGYVAFWLTRDGADLLEQPIVFFGSEGDVGVIAVSFADYLWLLADGLGPMEAVEYGAGDSKPVEPLVAFAQEHAPAAKKSAQAVLERAVAEFPKFKDDFMAQCR